MKLELAERLWGVPLNRLEMGVPALVPRLIREPSSSRRGRNDPGRKLNRAENSHPPVRRRERKLHASSRPALPSASSPIRRRPQHLQRSATPDLSPDAPPVPSGRFGVLEGRDGWLKQGSNRPSLRPMMIAVTSPYGYPPGAHYPWPPSHGRRWPGQKYIATGSTASSGQATRTRVLRADHRRPIY